MLALLRVGIAFEGGESYRFFCARKQDSIYYKCITKRALLVFVVG